ncbi:MAG TPA: glycoside hydrolase family 16 protein [Pyrinomonadaceae bacterium]|nr:glycoside hydrolase family 16 protein [Pyrinomonadaceae bacterium]
MSQTMRLTSPTRPKGRGPGPAALLFASALLLALAAPARAQTWTLAWADEFDGPAGARADAAKWTAETGGGGWGNQELQFYTDTTKNAFTDGAGSLVIKAVRETPPRESARCWYGPCRYTSARLVTKHKFAQAYGRFEARLKVPYGQGIWPAFWMLGANIDAAGWPSCGEIDIMENIGREPSTVHGTLHGPGYSGAGGVGAGYTLPAGRRFADDFHTFAVEWEPNAVRWYVDGRLYQTRTPGDLPAGARWVFDHPFFIILNVAVGGRWPGGPDATTVFPQTMRVDYVRVYRRRPGEKTVDRPRPSQHNRPALNRRARAASPPLTRLSQETPDSQKSSPTP